MVRVFCFLFPGFLFCGSALAQGSVPVLVSIAPQKYLVERIAGDNLVQVSTLLRPGANPHTWEPGPEQMRAVTAARLWFTIGLPFEESLLPRLKTDKLHVVSMIRGLKRLAPAPSLVAHDGSGQAQDGKEEHGEDLDPHVWLSPMLARAMLPGVVEALSEILPDKAGELRVRAADLARELEELDAGIAEKLDALPTGKRSFLTLHPAWRYFAMNYGLEELSISPDGREPGPKSLQAVADAAKERGLTCILVEEQFYGSLAEAVASALGLRIVRVNPLGEDLLFVYRDITDKIIASLKP
jgi:zinc transport system substrate-binding protein